MALLKQDGFHITLDTTGFAPPAALDRILPLVDLVLLDIKHYSLYGVGPPQKRPWRKTLLLLQLAQSQQTFSM